MLSLLCLPGILVSILFYILNEVKIVITGTLCTFIFRNKNVSIINECILLDQRVWKLVIKLKDHLIFSNHALHNPYIVYLLLKLTVP